MRLIYDKHRLDFGIIMIFLGFIVVISLLIRGNQTWGNTVTPNVSNPTLSVQFNECFDLDSKQIIQPLRSNDICLNRDWDIRFSFNSGNKPIHSVLFQNSPQVLIAYINKPFDNVDQSTIKDVSFTSDYLDIPFNSTAIVFTDRGYYYKVSLVEEGEGTITFQWDLLL